MPHWRKRIKFVRMYDCTNTKLPWAGSGAVHYSPKLNLFNRKIIDDKKHYYKTIHYGTIDRRLRDKKRIQWNHAPESIRGGWTESEKAHTKDGKMIFMDYLSNETHEEFLLRRSKFLSGEKLKQEIKNKVKYEKDNQI